VKTVKSHGLITEVGDIRCYYCGSTNIIWKGRRKRKNDIGRVGLCKNCRKYFTFPLLKIRKKVVTAEIVRRYVKGESLRQLSLILGCSKSELHRQILKSLKSIPSWEYATAQWLNRLQNKKWFKNLVIDTTTIKVGGKRRVYLHAVDNCFKRPLIYTIIKKEDRESVARELRKLKNLGYYPDVVTTDLAPELLSAIKEVFPWAKIQGCLFHLARLLREKLGNCAGRERSTKDNMLEQAILDREKAKNLILHAACADLSTRQTMISKLMQMCYCSSVDKDTKKAIRDNFLDRYREIYHPLEELNGHAEALTTNICERHIGLIKSYKRRLYGFKSPKTAQKLIDAFWFFYTKEKNFVCEELNQCNQRKIEGAGAFLLKGHISIGELSNLVGLTRQDLLKIAKKKGKIVIFDYPISRKQIQRILELTPKVENLGELSEIMALNPFVIKSVLNKYGFTVKPENPQLKLDKILNFDFSEILNAKIIKPQ